MQPSADREVPRWYILTYTGNLDTAVQRLKAVSGLQFYAPEFFFEQSALSRRESWFFRNYAFVYGSQNYIYELKKCELQDFNFMRNNSTSGVLHPFVSANEIDQLKKVEQMYDGKIPLTLSTGEIVVGDRIEILTGEFKGYEAKAITKYRSKFRQVYLFIGNFLVIPLCKLKEEEFRIIQYANPVKKTAEFCLSVESATAIIDAIKRFYGILPSDKETIGQDCSEMAKLIALCEKNTSFSINNRLKALSLQGLAFMMIGENEKSLRYLKLANAILQEKVTAVARLFYATMRYLSTTLPNHYSEYKVLKKEAHRSLTHGSCLFRFIECAEELNAFLAEQTPQNASREIFSGGRNIEHWFCISAPQKKTEAVRLFRDKNIPLYAPIVSDGRNKDQKNLLKDLFFVKMTYNALTALHNENHGAFSILSQSLGSQKRFYTYSDEDIETFDFVNSLDIPNKDILKYTAEDEIGVCKSNKKTITLGERELTGHLMTQHSGNKTQEKVVFLLKGVIAIAVTL